MASQATGGDQGRSVAKYRRTERAASVEFDIPAGQADGQFHARFVVANRSPLQTLASMCPKNVIDAIVRKKQEKHPVLIKLASGGAGD